MILCPVDNCRVFLMICGTISHLAPGDCQKVNCPKGTREATLGCGLTASQMPPSPRGRQ